MVAMRAMEPFTSSATKITGPMMSRRETTGGAGNGRMDGRRR
jgi:hypothetical protein